MMEKIKIEDVPVEILQEVKQKWSNAMQHWSNNIWTECSMCKYVESKCDDDSNKCEICPLYHHDWCKSSSWSSRIHPAYYNENMVSWRQEVQEFVNWIDQVIQKKTGDEMSKDEIEIKFLVRYQYDAQESQRYARVVTYIQCDDGVIPEILRNSSVMCSGNALTSAWGVREGDYRYSFSHRIEKETWEDCREAARQYISNVLSQLEEIAKKNIQALKTQPENEEKRYTLQITHEPSVSTTEGKKHTYIRWERKHDEVCVLCGDSISIPPRDKITLLNKRNESVPVCEDCHRAVHALCNLNP